jgi:hypothetical protein
MADGEPPDRHATKIGGLPYRPASAPWPRLPGNIPLVFLAQFNFCDSQDLTGKLPGDVLLVFTEEPWSPGYLHFEWQPLGMGDLVEPTSVPEPLGDVELEAFRRDKERFGPIHQKLNRMGIELPDEIPHPTNCLAPCYGHVCRVDSFPEARPRDENWTGATCRGKQVAQELALLSYQATQIGEAPFFIQEISDRLLPGRVLCTISSVQPAFDKPYPWINRPQPLDALGQRPGRDDHFTVLDMGCIYISIDKKGKLHWQEECY